MHDDGVERVAVQHQQAAAVGGDVDRVLHDLDAAELQPRVVAQPLVMIARDVDDPRALADLAQNLLDDVVVRLRPVPGFLQAPAVDDVADQIDRLRFGVAQEVEQKLGLAAAGAEMQVGDPDRAIGDAFASGDVTSPLRRQRGSERSE